MKAMILAAGRGERMQPLTNTTPKALLPVGECTLIEHHLHALVAAGIRDIVINVAWLGGQIMTFLGTGDRYGCQIQYSEEGDSALETGGGIARALPLLGEQPFWVVNGDVYARFDFPLIQLAATDLGHLLLAPNPEHNAAGDFGLIDGRVANAGQTMYTFSGISLLRPELLAGHPGGAFSLAPLLRKAASAGQLTGELLSDHWLDVGTPERLEQAVQLSRVNES